MDTKDLTNTDLPNQNAEEQQLLRQVAEGDENAFRTLFYRHLPALNAFIVKFVKSPYATEEIIQNLFIRVWLNREKLEEVRNIRSWLYKYASNECLSYLRTFKQKECVLQTVDDQSELIAFTTENTASHINVKEIKNLINIAVSKLPEQRRRVYLLSRQSGLTIPEIAEELSISPSTAKNTLVLSLKSIRGFLSQHGYHYSTTLFYILFFR